jgi:hypothetical protein
LLNFEKTVVITENNKVFQSLLKFIKEFPNFKLESGLPLFEVESQKYIPSYNKYGQLQTMRPIIDANDYQLAGWVDNGKQVIISINDESVARAIKGFGVKKTIPIFNSINRYLKTMYTAASIPFLFTNFQKDMGTALVNISQQEQKGLRREMVKNVFPAIKGAIAGSRGATTGKWVRIYLDYARHGAKASWVKNYSLEEKVKDFEKKIKRYKKSNDVVKIIEATVNFVEDLNSAVENGIRIAAYEGLVRRGVSKQKAAIAAKNLTVNFQKKGEWGPVMDSLFLFANASVQGTAILLEASKNKKVRKIIAGLIVGQTLMALMNGMFGGDDYDKIPSHIKDTNFIFMLPNGKHLRIKYPFGYSFFLVLGNTLADGMRGKADIGESIKRIFTGFSSAFNPIGSISSFKQFITPTIFDPIVQIAGNNTFYGGPIHPEQIPWNEVPKSQLYFDGVSDGTKALTLWINRVSGGARGVSGDIDINPEVLDHLLNFAVGSAGRFVTQTLEMGVSLFKDGKLPPTKKIPIVNLFYGERSMYIDVQTVYKMLKEGTHKVYSKREKRNFIKALEDATNEGRFTNKQFQDIRDRFKDQQRDNKLLLERGTSKQMWKALDILSKHEIRSEEETKEFLRLLGIAADKGNFTNEEYQKFRNKYFNQQKKLTKIKKIEENK